MKKYIEEEFEFFAKDLNFQQPTVSQVTTYSKPFSYSKHVPLGLTIDGDKLNISFVRSKKMLIFGGTGSGKSFISRGLFNRAKKGGLAVFIIDLKGEYLSSKKPAQEKFHKFFLPNEEPQGFKMKVFYPFFFTKHVNRELDDNEELCQFGIESLNEFDFLTLFGDVSDTMRDYINKIFSKVRSGEIRTLDKIKQEIIEDRKIGSSTKDVLVRKIERLERDGIVGNTYDPPDIINSLKEGNITVLNLKGFIKFAKFNEPASAYVAICLRMIYNAKVEGILPKDMHILIVLDEVNRFAPNFGNPSSKEEILKMLDLSRSEAISMLFSSQDRNRVPDTIFMQCTIIIVSKLVGLDELADIIKQKVPSRYDYPITFKVEVSSYYQQMSYYKTGQRDWLYINSVSDEIEIFSPLAPLSAHLEES